MMTLTDFLLARIAEDEAAATVTIPCPDSHRLPRGLGCAVVHQQVDRRVLAECEAKRRIVERHDSDGWDFACEVPGYGRPDPQQCPDLRALAAVYSDHDDYRPEWRP